MTDYNFKEFMSRPDRLTPGHRMCAGCGATIALRNVLKALEPEDHAVICNATSCMEVSTFTYPYSSWTDSYIHNAFENAAATAGGVEAAYNALKKKGKIDDTFKFIAVGGDGGTYDIGFQSLSGAMERNHDMVYVCYDNEAYMNTGVQGSGLTPMGATTTTTPAGKYSYGETHVKKNMFEIMVAHRIPYCATASAAYPNDLVTKVEKARDIKGPAFLHVMAPCPTGWGFASDLTVEIGRLAVETGMWSLLEYENGKIKVNKYAENPKDVKEYLMAQRRFRHLNDEQIVMITAQRDKELEKIRQWAEQ